MVRTRFRTILIGAFGLATLAAVAVGAAVGKSDVPGTDQVIGLVGTKGTIVGTNIKNHLDVTITSVPVGEGVHAQVGVSGFNGTPTGQVFVSWYMTADCSDDSQVGWTETLVN